MLVSQSYVHTLPYTRWMARIYIINIVGKWKSYIIVQLDSVLCDNNTLYDYMGSLQN